MAKKETKIGAYIFIAGIVIAIISGILMNFMDPVIITSVLMILGLIVGFLNVTEKEVKDYLLTAVCLVIVTALGGASIQNLMIIGPYLAGVLHSIMIFTIPTAIVVALKEIVSIAKN
ncbi:MAG TPA: hypothetical protein P5530_02025 [Candidatus Diapherotrites archaeon]|nr:hypothetical protein [Candidatus Diapherotrites archaeon]